MAKRMTKTEREDLMERMRGDEIKRCLASEIYAQGVTFNHVRALINLSGGGANTSTIQKPGRLAEVRPNKKCGVVFDFLFIPGSGTGNGIQALYRESMARVKAYTEKGYEIIYVNSYNELETSFKSKAI
jgi:superfamily II DNA/RNA helicase